MNPEVPAEGTGCFRVPHSPRGWARNQMPRVQIPALPLSSRTTWAGYLTSPRLLFSLIKQGRIIAPASLDRDSSGEHLSKMCSHLGSVLRLAQGFFN